MAIDLYRNDHGLVPIAVCCRLSEYEALPKKLRLDQAVVVQPLSAKQIDEYLAAAGSELAGLRRALTGDNVQANDLRVLSADPLMLRIMAVAFQNNCTVDLVAADRTPYLGVLFGRYVDHVFERRSRKTRYSRKRANEWLCWLARKLAARNETIFLIERL